jgi:hypothetical protein
VQAGPPPQRTQLIARPAPPATRRDRMRAELAGATAWIAAIGAHPPADRR